MSIMNVVLSTLLTIALTSTTDAGTGTEPSMESAPTAPSADVDSDRQNPMLGFSRLVGGAWEIGPLRHVFEWGIARSSVISRSYDAEGKLAAEARWFWHPGQKAIKGYSVDATGAFFAEMTTSFEGSLMINELTTFAADGSKSDYTGKWEFTTEDSYDWTLYNRTDEGLAEAMSLTAKRVND